MEKKCPTLSNVELASKGDQCFLPHISINCVIFGFHDNRLKVLLLQWKESQKWCLPGGFIYIDEHIDEAAGRILHEQTGLRDICPNQFYTFGDPSSEPGKRNDKLLEAPLQSRFVDRFISIGYIGLIEFSKATPKPNQDLLACAWWDIGKVPKLMKSHTVILRKALDCLRRYVHNYPVGKDLLPEKFTMPDLLSLYEAILGRNLDRRNFQKKMLSLEIFELQNERRKGGAHKAAYLYKFNHKKCQDALKVGMKFGL